MTKTIRVSPELVADLLADYLDNHPKHIEGQIFLEVTEKSWSKFEKAVTG